MVDHSPVVTAVVMGLEFMALTGAAQHFLAENNDQCALAVLDAALQANQRCLAAVEVIRMECSGP